MLFRSFGFLASFLIILIFHFFSDTFLLLLGERYSGYNTELVMFMISSVLATGAGLSFNLNMARGWTFYPVLLIALNITSLIIGISFFTFDNLTGVISFNIFINAFQYLMNTTFCFFKILTLPE